METVARHSTTPFAVLAMLSLGPKSGYDINRELAFSARHFWAESNGQLYPVLRSLVAAGLATVRRHRSSARRRTIYTITPKGRQAIAEWLEQPSAVPSARNELLLKLFVGWHVSLGVSAAHVEQLRTALAAQRDHFAVIRSALDQEGRREPDAEFWRITVRSGEAVAAARLAWCDETLDTLRRLGRRLPRTSAAARSRRMNRVMQRLWVRLHPSAPQHKRTRRKSS